MYIMKIQLAEAMRYCPVLPECAYHFPFWSEHVGCQLHYSPGLEKLPHLIHHAGRPAYCCGNGTAGHSHGWYRARTKYEYGAKYDVGYVGNPQGFHRRSSVSGTPEDAVQHPE
jgi:hypothetical protein